MPVNRHSEGSGLRRDLTIVKKFANLHKRHKADRKRT